MRLRITLDDATVAALDEQRWDALEASVGAAHDVPHDWDADPAAWVRAQRAEPRRAG